MDTNKIKQKREQLGWSKEMLAAKSGLSLSTIRNLERYPNGPSTTIRSLVYVCNALGLRITDLVSVPVKRKK